MFQGPYASVHIARFPPKSQKKIDEWTIFSCSAIALKKYNYVEPWTEVNCGWPQNGI